VATRLNAVINDLMFYSIVEIWKRASGYPLHVLNAEDYPSLNPNSTSPILSSVHLFF
jgi:hypothetical protein